MNVGSRLVWDSISVKNSGRGNFARSLFTRSVQRRAAGSCDTTVWFDRRSSCAAWSHMRVRLWGLDVLIPRIYVSSASPPLCYSSVTLGDSRRSCVSPVHTLFVYFWLWVPWFQLQSLNLKTYSDLLYNRVFQTLCHQFLLLFQHGHSPAHNAFMHKEMVFPVWCGRTWLVCTESWPQTPFITQICEPDLIAHH